MTRCEGGQAEGVLRREVRAGLVCVLGAEMAGSEWPGLS